MQPVVNGEHSSYQGEVVDPKHRDVGVAAILGTQLQPAVDAVDDPTHVAHDGGGSASEPSRALHAAGLSSASVPSIHAPPYWVQDGACGGAELGTWGASVHQEDDILAWHVGA